MTETLEEHGRAARRPRGLLPRLGLLAALVFAPLAAGLSLATIAHVATVEQAADTVLGRLALTGVFSVQAEVESLTNSLSAFAAALDLAPAQGDAEALDRTLRRAAGPLGTSLFLIDRNMAMQADTAIPFGSPMPAAAAPSVASQAFDTARPAIGSMQPAAHGIPAHVPVMMPVLRDHAVVAVLGGRIDRPHIERRLSLAGRAGTLLLFDAEGRLIAGRGWDWPEPPVLDPQELTAAGDAQPFNTMLGMPERQRVVARHVDAGTGWTIVATMPVSGLEAAQDTAMVPAVISVGIAIFFGFAGTVLLTGRLRRPIIALTDFAHAVSLAGDTALPVPPMALAMAEFEALRVNLLHATTALSAREKRHRALAETGALVTWRADSGGAITEAAGWGVLTGQEERACLGAGWLTVLHPDDRAPALAAWGRCLVARAPINVEYRVRVAEDPRNWRWVRATGVPVLDGTGRVTEWYGTVRDVGDRRGAIEARAANEAQVRQTLAELRAVYDSVPVGLALVDREMKFLNINARVAAISGLPTGSHIGRTAREVLPSGLAEPLEAAQHEVLVTGRPVLDVSCAGDAMGVVRHTRHWLASCHPVTNAEGTVTGVSAVLHDVTDRVRAEQSRELLLRELNHRVKNTLATVQSIAAQTLRATAAEPRRFGHDFVARLQALARAHDLLTAHAWEEAEFAQVVLVALAPWISEPGRFVVEGPSGLMLRPTQAQAAVLALHELATNAAKHGALSRQEGLVRARWTMDESGLVQFEWVESGGPPVVPPPLDKRGFGTRLLERALAQDLGADASVTLRFEPDGLRADIRFRAQFLPSVASVVEAKAAE